VIRAALLGFLHTWIVILATLGFGAWLYGVL
jgi:hypothetical protein